MHTDWPGTALAIALLLSATPAALSAEVTHDGSLGEPAGLSFDGTTYTIDERAGEVLGGDNLFYSFGTFDIGAGETAKFTTTTTPAGMSLRTSIDNILGRVTGGSPSDIQGTIDALDYDHANVFLMNPYGIIFGPGARLNVNGSFHATTADYVRLGETGLFYADTNGVSTLSTAPPTAFGFLDDTVSPISVDGSRLEVIRNGSLSLIAGDITVNRDALVVSRTSGAVNIVSVASPGEVILNPLGVDANRLQKSFDRWGNIEVSDAAIGASDGGTVLIRGGRFVVTDGGFIGARSVGDGEGGNIELTAKRIEVSDGGFIGSQSLSSRSGDGGHVELTAERIEVSDGGFIGTSTGRRSRGDGGDVEIAAELIVVSNDGTIGSRALNRSLGNGGFVLLSAPRIDVHDRGSIVSQTESFGQAGIIAIDTIDLEVQQGGIIETRSDAAGDAGDIRIRGEHLSLRGGGAIVSRTSRESSGRAGDIAISARELDITNATLSSVTEGSGSAGDVAIRARDATIASTVVSTDTFSTGDGGDIELRIEGKLEITDSAELVARALGPEAGAGNAGDITIEAGEFELTDGGLITTSADRSGSDSEAGSVLIRAPAYTSRTPAFLLRRAPAALA